MNSIIVFKTETTGIPDWKMPSEDINQPHLVKLAALQFDIDKQKIIQSMDVIIKPESWEISPETIEQHGITKEYAMDVGISECLAVEMFVELWAGRTRIAFNTTFHNRIMRIATLRYSPDHVGQSWKDGPYECAMSASRKVMASKQPSLEEAYEYFTGKILENPAVNGCNACLEVYRAIKAQDVLREAIK